MLEIEIDNKKIEADENSSLLDILQKSGKKNNNIVACYFNDELVDLSYKPNISGVMIPVKNDSDEGLTILRHSTSHLMAHAVIRLFKDVLVSIGPAIKDGFYYDFDIEKTFTDEDLPKIEAEMKSIIKENIALIRKDMKRTDAIEYFKNIGEKYKVEILEGIDAEMVSFYEQGDFIDLCRGPHVPSTGYIKSYKLMSVAGAYWRGDEKNQMLSRIYGVAFEDKLKLEAYLKRLKEAKERDHRKIGKDLDLFSFHEEGPGFPFWHPNGMVIYRELELFARQKNEQYGYDEIRTPIILNESLWHKSGHWDNYKSNMYFTKIDELDFAVKPMNCPGGLLVFKSKMHSYKELPIRTAEFGLVHRHELSGVLHGLFRVRSFTQDDAHTFCTSEQMVDEIKTTIEYTLNVYKTFGFENYEIFIATRPQKSIGTDEEWTMATNALTSSLDELNISYKIKDGDGAFYGPKIEFNIKDVLERNWQCGTIQVDFSMPKRFDIHYEGSDGKRHFPVMLHRTILGSLERFIGILIEHYNGKFPLWLSPLQVLIVPVSNDEKQLVKCSEIEKILLDNGIRVKIDDSNENLGYKIRRGRLQRTPYIVIIGDEELSSSTVSLRLRSGVESKGMVLQEVVEKLLVESREYMNNSIFE